MDVGQRLHDVELRDCRPTETTRLNQLKHRTLASNALPNILR
jgi:hypothetical protein